MAFPAIPEKPVIPEQTPSRQPIVAPSYFNPVSPLWNAIDRFNQWRSDLGLPHPGTVENLQKEVKGVSEHLSVYK
jgi:mitochondrial import receptor subunit TOM40